MCYADFSLNAGIGRGLLKSYGKEIAVRNPGNAPMTECVSVIQGKRGTAIEIGTGLETGTAEGTVRKTMGVTVIVVIEIETGTVAGIMIERRSVVVLMTVNVREAGIAIETTSIQIMNVNALTCVRGMLIMPMVSQSMIEA